jgi:hypothetical protein
VEEYFSMYFRLPHYGNPDMVAYSKIPPKFWPYGGVDTRVFFTRPHIQTTEHPLSFDSQVFIVSAEKGVYFRYLYDTVGSLRMDLNIIDLTVVLLKNYRPPAESRGFRGTAGSGRGARTLVERLVVNWNYHYSKPQHHLDMMFSTNPVRFANSRSKRGQNYQSQAPVSPTQRSETNGPSNNVPWRKPGGVGTSSSALVSATDETAATRNNNLNQSKPYINIDSDKTPIKLPAFYVPKSIIPLMSNQRSFNKSMALIVSSYEDVLLSVTLVLDFLGLPNIWSYTEEVPQV